MQSFWKSKNEKLAEFNYIKKLLQDENIVIPPDGLKISRKDPAHHGKISHSFIILPDNGSYKIAALGNKSDDKQGRLGADFVKLMELEDDEQFAVAKIITVDLAKEKTERKANTPEIEYKFLQKSDKSIGFFTRGEKKYLFQKLAKGVNLSDFTTRLFNESKSELSIPDRIKIISEILSEVNDLYQRGIIHRDLHIKNIFINKVGEHFSIDIIDFDFSRERSTEDADLGLSDLNRHLYDSLVSVASFHLKKYLPFTVNWDAFESLSSASGHNSFIPSDPEMTLLLFKLSVAASNSDEAVLAIDASDRTKLIDYIEHYHEKLNENKALRTTDPNHYYQESHKLFIQSMKLLHRFDPSYILPAHLAIEYISRYPHHMMVEMISELQKPNNQLGITLTRDQIWADCFDLAGKDSQHIPLLMKLFVILGPPQNIENYYEKLSSQSKALFAHLCLVEKISLPFLQNTQSLPNHIQTILANKDQYGLNYIFSYIAKLPEDFILANEKMITAFLLANKHEISNTAAQLENNFLPLLKKLSPDARAVLLKEEEFPFKFQLFLSLDSTIRIKLTEIFSSEQKSDDNIGYLLLTLTDASIPLKTGTREDKVSLAGEVITHHILKNISEVCMLDEKNRLNLKQEILANFQKNLILTRHNGNPTIALRKDFIGSISHLVNLSMTSMSHQFEASKENPVYRSEERKRII